MKAIVLVTLLFVCITYAADPVFKYAGTTKGSAEFTYPTFDSEMVCSVGTDTSPYVNFTVLFSTSGVREIAAMAENSFKSYITLYVYRGGSFNPASPCANILLILDTSNNKRFSSRGGPVIDDFPYFEGASYDVVVSGGSSGGIFAVNILPSDAVGTIGATDPAWNIPQFYDNDCVDSGYEGHYRTYTFTQATSGYFDLFVLLYNNSLSGLGAAVVLYQGTPNFVNLTTAEDFCNSTLTNTSIIAINSASSGGVFIPYAYLSAGAVYTLVFSPRYTSQTGYFGVQVIPTRIRFQKPSAWTQPSRYIDDGCEDSSYTTASWDATLFTTEERAYLIDTAEPPAPFVYFDTYSFLYEGSNTGNSLFSPFTCPIYAPLVNFGDTGDVTPVFAIVNPGENYTVIVSTYNGYNKSQTEDYDYAYVLYLFTGLPIGVLPQPNITSTTSTTDTTATTATTGTTAATATTGTTLTSTTTTAASSTAAAAAATTTAASTSNAASTSVASTTTASSTTAAATTAATTSAASTAVASTVATTTTAAATTATTKAATTTTGNTTSTTAKTSTGSATTTSRTTTTSASTTSNSTSSGNSTATTAAAATTTTGSKVTSSTSGASQIVLAPFALVFLLFIVVLL